MISHSSSKCVYHGFCSWCGQHPRAHQRAAAADDAGDALGRQRQVFQQDAGVDRHVIDALLGLVLDHVEHHAAA